MHYFFKLILKEYLPRNVIMKVAIIMKYKPKLSKQSNRLSKPYCEKHSKAFIFL